MTQASQHILLSKKQGKSNQIPNIEFTLSKLRHLLPLERRKKTNYKVWIRTSSHQQGEDVIYPNMLLVCEEKRAFNKQFLNTFKKTCIVIITLRGVAAMNDSKEYEPNRE